jgi:hypothetical protein
MTLIEHPFNKQITSNRNARRIVWHFFMVTALRGKQAKKVRLDYSHVSALVSSENGLAFYKPVFTSGFIAQGIDKLFLYSGQPTSFNA